MTHFKNIITAVMLLVLAVIFSITDFVVAQGAGLVRISPEESQVAVGSEIVLEVVIEDGEDVNAFDVIVTYNPELLSLTNWAYGDYLSNLADIPVEEEPGMIQIWSTQLATPPVSGDGVLVTLTFEGLADGVSAITLTRAELSDPQGNKMLPTIRDGSVAVGDAQANPATATPAITQTQAPTNAVATTVALSRTPTPTSPSASTGYPDRGTPTQAPTRTPSAGVQTTRPGATATSTRQPGEATPEPQETDATRVFTPTTQVGVTEPSSTEPGEVAPPAEDSTPTQADPGQEPSTPPAQDEQGLSLGLWLAMGLGLIVLGGGAFVLLRRQREKNYKEDLL